MNESGYVTAADMNDKAIEVCLRPDCGRPAKLRGLCNSCYGVAKKLIKEGRI